jgi:hypothetical protein
MTELLKLLHAQDLLEEAEKAVWYYKKEWEAALDCDSLDAEGEDRVKSHLIKCQALLRLLSKAHNERSAV